MTKQEKLRALRRLKKFVKGKDFGVGKGRYIGLCGAIYYLQIVQDMDNEQAMYLDSLIPKKRPFDGYCWRRGAKKPRIEFINKKIKQLRSKK